MELRYTAISNVSRHSSMVTFGKRQIADENTIRNREGYCGYAEEASRKIIESDITYAIG
jgi:hypothetical protein